MLNPHGNYHQFKTWLPQNITGNKRSLPKLASIVFHAPLYKLYISANKKKASGLLKRNRKINLKKADEGTTTVTMNTAQKIEEGSQKLLSDDKFYKPLTNAIKLHIAQKVNRIVNKLFLPGNIDTMTQMV